jgi:hypothetical protein
VLQLYSHNLQFSQLQKEKINSISIQTKSNMKLNLFFLSTAAMVNAASATDCTAAIDLGDAVEYAILSNAISTVPLSTITGDIAVTATSASITGFSLITADIVANHPIESNVRSSDYPQSIQVIGDVKASDFVEKYYVAGTETQVTGDQATELTKAYKDMEEAYVAAAACTTTKTLLDPNTNENRLDLKGQTLYPGVYTFNAGVGITSGEVTFDGGNVPNAVFIIQVNGNFLQAAGTMVKLSGGALAKNIFWQVTGTVTVNGGATVGAHLEGIVLAKTAVTFITESSLNGRIFSQSMTPVALGMATITQPPL